jgi:hypothetical protein
MTGSCSLTCRILCRGQLLVVGASEEMGINFTGAIQMHSMKHALMPTLTFRQLYWQASTTLCLPCLHTSLLALWAPLMVGTCKTLPLLQCLPSVMLSLLVHGALLLQQIAQFTRVTILASHYDKQKPLEQRTALRAAFRCVSFPPFRSIFNSLRRPNTPSTCR